MPLLFELEMSLLHSVPVRRKPFKKTFSRNTATDGGYVKSEITCGSRSSERWYGRVLLSQHRTYAGHSQNPDPTLPRYGSDLIRRWLRNFSLLLHNVFLETRHEREDLIFLLLTHFELIERFGEMFGRRVPISI